MTKESKPSKAKLTLAAAGAGFLVVGIAFGVYVLVRGSGDAGPSRLTLHPENQEQILCERRAGELAVKLDLTPDQTAQVTELVKELRADGRETRRGNAGDRDAMISARMTGMQNFSAKMTALLTPEQRIEYDAMQQDAKGRFGQAMALRQQFGGDAQ